MRVDDAVLARRLTAACPRSHWSPASRCRSTSKDNTEVTNQVAAMLVELPTHLEDPVDQLAAVHAATVDAKEMQQAMGAGHAPGHGGAHARCAVQPARPGSIRVCAWQNAILRCTAS